MTSPLIKSCSWCKPCKASLCECGPCVVKTCYACYPDQKAVKLISLLHDISQLGYAVEFSDDFEGMLTITYKGEGLDWRHHEHIGYPRCERELLTEQVIRSLDNFLKEKKA